MYFYVCVYCFKTAFCVISLEWLISYTAWSLGLFLVTKFCMKYAPLYSFVVQCIGQCFLASCIIFLCHCHTNVCLPAYTDILSYVFINSKNVTSLFNDIV